MKPSRNTGYLKDASKLSNSGVLVVRNLMVDKFIVVIKFSQHARLRPIKSEIHRVCWPYKEIFCFFQTMTGIISRADFVSIKVTKGHTEFSKQLRERESCKKMKKRILKSSLWLYAKAKLQTPSMWRLSEVETSRKSQRSFGISGEICWKSPVDL